jgi:hypothetical protein
MRPGRCVRSLRPDASEWMRPVGRISSDGSGARWMAPRWATLRPSGCVRSDASLRTDPGRGGWPPGGSRCVRVVASDRTHLLGRIRGRGGWPPGGPRFVRVDASGRTHSFGRIRGAWRKRTESRARRERASWCRMAARSARVNGHGGTVFRSRPSQPPAGRVSSEWMRPVGRISSDGFGVMWSAPWWATLRPSSCVRSDAFLRTDPGRGGRPPGGSRCVRVVASGRTHFFGRIRAEVVGPRVGHVASD